MQTISDEFKETVLGPGNKQHGALVQVYDRTGASLLLTIDDTQRSPDNPAALSWEVSVDASADCRRALTLTIPNVDGTYSQDESNPDNWAFAENNIISLKSGYLLSGGWDLKDTFYGLIDRASMTNSIDGMPTVTITARSVEKKALQSKFDVTTAYTDTPTESVDYAASANGASATATSNLAIGDALQTGAKVYQTKPSATVMGISKSVAATESGDLRDGTYEASYSEPGLTEFSVQPYIDLRATESVQAATVDAHNPADPTFTRSSVAYKSDGTQVASGVPRYETGVFGQAVMLEEGTQNLLKNASFEVYTGTNGVADGWTSTYDAAVTASYAINTTEHRLSGAKSQEIDITASTGAGRAAVVQTQTEAAGVIVTASAYVKGSVVGGTKARIYIQALDSGGALLGTSTVVSVVPSASWARFSTTWTTPTNTASVRIGVDLFASAAGDTGTVYFDDVQLEAKAYPSSIIFANDTTTQAARAAESLTIPTAGVLSATEGTVEFTILPLLPSSVTTQDGYGFHDFAWLTGTTSGFILRRRVGLIELVSLRAAGNISKTYTISWTAGDTIRAGARWDATGITLLVNGSPRGTIALFDDPGSAAAYLGSRSGYTPGNALYDDLRISSRARTDAEILADYQSGQPLPVDADTTYKLGFDGSLTNAAVTTVSDMQVSTDGVTWSAYAPGTWRYLRFTAKSPGSMIKLGLTVTAGAARAPSSAIDGDNFTFWRPSATDLDRTLTINFGQSRTWNVAYVQIGANPIDVWSGVKFKLLNGDTGAVIADKTDQFYAGLVEIVPASAVTCSSVKIQVTGSAGVVAIRTVEVYNITVNNSVTFLLSDMATQAGITNKTITTSKLYRSNLTCELGDDYLQRMKEVADTVAWELYGDPTGFLIAKPFRYDPNSPVMTYKAGEANITSLSKNPNGEGIFNWIVVRSEQPDQTIISTAKDDALGSPTSTQRLGKRVKAITDNTILKQKAADQRALLELWKNTKWKAPISLDYATANPAHEVYDVVWVEEENTKTKAPYLLNAFRLSYTPEAFSMSLELSPVG